MTHDRKATLREFEDYLFSIPLAPYTVEKYGQRLRQILTACDGEGWDACDLSVSQVRFVAGQFSPSRSSQAHVKTVLRHYWDMRRVKGPIAAINLPPETPARYRGLEPDEAAALEQAAVEAGHQRGTAVLLGLYLGLRREEIATLRWSHFDDDLGWVSITGKGSRTRYIPVSPVLRAVLKPHRVGSGWLFPSQRNNRAYVAPATVNHWTQALADKAGIRHLTAHGLRHTCLATINDTTGDLRTTQAFAGHSQIASTTRYTRATKSKLLAAAGVLDYRLHAG